jgi:AcrR family transcriptional regulator
MPKRERRRERRTQEERSETTKRALVEAAREQFATMGFAATSIDDVIRKVGVTRGALYHHFESKTELFRAAFEVTEKELTHSIAMAAQGARDGWSAFRAGCKAFLEACLEPKVQQVVLLDAPSVLGWEGMRAIEARYALALLQAGLERCMAEGYLERRPVEPVAHFWLGALAECAMSIARAPDPKVALAETQRELDRMLRAFGRR